MGGNFPGVNFPVGNFPDTIFFVRKSAKKVKIEIFYFTYRRQHMQFCFFPFFFVIDEKKVLL